MIQVKGEVNLSVVGGQRGPMRLYLCFASLMLVACQMSGEPVQVHRADAAAALAREMARAPVPQSPASYQIELRSVDADGMHLHANVYAPYQLSAFGGELMGDDRGEWGGELMFRDAQGGVHKVLGKNVHGIYVMPFGVAVFTGLAHMGMNSGEVYLVSLAKDGSAVATPFRTLAGAPMEMVRAVSGELVFKVPSGHFRHVGDHMEEDRDCYRMTMAGKVESLSCSDIVIVD